MARMIPTQPIDTRSRGELDLFSIFQRQLPNDYHVLHSLRWLGGKSKVEGEIDFVIFHPKKGLLLLEVKSGKIEYRNRLLLQTNSKTGEVVEIDPIGQLRASKHKLIDLLKKVLHRGAFCPIGYAVWFPTFSLNGELPPDMSPDFTGDFSDLTNSLSFLEKAYGYWLNVVGQTVLSDQNFNSVLHALCGEFSIAPSLKAQFDFREQQFVRLTNEQARILEFLEEQPHAVISGAAGTGKTLLAMEKCRRLAENREPTLYLCFNRQLRQFLSLKFPSNSWLQVHTFHSLAASLLPPCPNLEMLEYQFSDLLLDDRFEFPFQHVIVDEGQDFREEWLDLMYLKEPQTFYIFYDKHQSLFQSELSRIIAEADCRLTLTRNCRNTRQIGKTATKMLQMPADRLLAEAVEGEKPILLEVGSVREGFEKVKHLIKHHVREIGGDLHEIAILTLSSLEKSAFSELPRQLGFPVSEEFEQNKITFTTARKFKGLEAALVVLLDLDLPALCDPLQRNLTYVACSRAKHALFWVVVRPEETDYAQALANEFAGRRRTANRQAFKSHFSIQIQ